MDFSPGFLIEGRFLTKEGLTEEGVDLVKEYFRKLVSWGYREDLLKEGDALHLRCVLWKGDYGAEDGKEIGSVGGSNAGA